MSEFILDTNVVSEIRKKPGRINPKVAQWYKALPETDIFISAVTVGEIRFGIEVLRKNDPTQSLIFEMWLGSILESYEGRILPITAETADIWGKIRSPRTLSLADALIGATAVQQGYTVATRNIGDFQNLGIKLFNPFA